MPLVLCFMLLVNIVQAQELSPCTVEPPPGLIVKYVFGCEEEAAPLCDPLFGCEETIPEQCDPIFEDCIDTTPTKNATPTCDPIFEDCDDTTTPKNITGSTTVITTSSPEVTINPNTVAAFKDTGRQGLTDFAQHFYLKLRDRPNFVFSPLVLHSALTLLQLGATPGSDTLEEIISTPWWILQNISVLKASYKLLLNTYKNQTKFLYGNYFWVKDSFESEENFSQTAQDTFNSRVDTVNFESIERVEKDNKDVGQLIKEQVMNAFNSDAKLLITSAANFKADFLVPFHKIMFRNSCYRKGSFETPNKGQISVSLIQQKSSLTGYKQIKIGSLFIEVLTIPYDNSRFELHIVLPRNNREMKILQGKMFMSNERNLSPEDFSYFNLFSKITKAKPADTITEVFLKMPSFKIRHDVDAKRTLQQLGVEKV